ncbi:MAG: AarF/ABC1/UbiB kinase family protein [Thermoanaerobaculales bacterium]|nr:AarF/ABC1/UbiB kinase family protein [Thermoanaerobaculales bacterium]
MASDEMITSAVRRFVKLGGLAGRVGASVVGNQVLDVARSGPAKQIKRTENLVRNAMRIAETLGEMKGAAMKVGQMMSLHEGMLPPEVAEILRGLQKEAPRVPAEVMEFEIRGSLENFDDLFEELDFEAFAAASIGQVHRGRLRDGREVAVKIQYPLIDEIVKADLKNLKTLLRALLGLITDLDFEPIWTELRDRLLEELDYTHEASNIRRMAEFHAEVPEIIIPAVVEEATTRNVLTMEFVGGISPTEACSDEFDEETRNRWGIVLVEFLMRGLMEHRFLHADPNLANFAFREDGRVVVYDFGCVKEVPEELAKGYGDLLVAAAERGGEQVSEVMRSMGMHMKGGGPLPPDAIDPYVEIFGEILRAEPPYTFGDDEGLYSRLFDLGFSNMEYSKDMVFPEDAIFIHRSLGGHFGNLSRLRATGPWRDLVFRYASSGGVSSPSKRSN